MLLSPWLPNGSVVVVQTGFGGPLRVAYAPSWRGPDAPAAVSRVQREVPERIHGLGSGRQPDGEADARWRPLSAYVAPARRAASTKLLGEVGTG